MSEVKFACPVCGQHITADASQSGGQLECPTCFQKIVVPQASAGDSKFILSAAQVSKPRPVSSVGSESNLSAKESSKASRVAAIALIAFLLAVGATGFVFREKIFKPRAQQEGEVSAKTPKKALSPAPPRVIAIPTNINWSLDVAELEIPEGNVVGSIHGSGFICERATLQGGNLTLRQGRSGPPELGVTIQFFAQQGEELSGKKIEISAERTPPIPKLTLRWRDEQQQEAKKTIPSGYALKAIFGEAANGRIPGKIFICLPDENKSFVAGNFTADIRKPNPPKQKTPKTPKPPKTSG